MHGELNANRADDSPPWDQEILTWTGLQSDNSSDEACSDGPIGYNLIGVASGRSAQATGASTDNAPISLRFCGGCRICSLCRRFIDRALPHRSNAQLGPGAAHPAFKDCAPFGPAYFRARTTRAATALTAR